MSTEKNSVRIETTDEQPDTVAQPQTNADDFAVEELEERIAPTTLGFQALEDRIAPATLVPRPDGN